MGSVNETEITIRMGPRRVLVNRYTKGSQGANMSSITMKLARTEIYLSIIGAIVDPSRGN